MNKYSSIFSPATHRRLAPPSLTEVVRTLCVFVARPRLAQLAALWLGLILPVLAQSTGGRIIGRVSDASGAVIVGCDIRLMNESTGTSSTVRTDSNGDYAFLEVAPAGDLQPAPALVSIFEDNADHVVQLVQVQWRAADPIDLYVIKPKGVAKPPVIVWLYGFPAETDFFKDETFHKLVTRGGFAAIGFMTALTGHRFHDRPMSSWFVSELQESLATSAHDVQMVLDYLSARDDLDMSRVGLFGQGSGGSIGILAAAVDPRIKVLDTLVPWADFPDWLAKSPLIDEDERGAYNRPEFLRKVASLDPVVWLPKVQARKIRLQDAAFNRVTPEVCKDKLKSVMPSGNATVRYETAKELQSAADGSILEWLKHELNDLPAL